MPEDTKKKKKKEEEERFFFSSLYALYLIITADLKGQSLDSDKTFSKSGSCFIMYLTECCFNEGLNPNLGKQPTTFQKSEVKGGQTANKP